MRKIPARPNSIGPRPGHSSSIRDKSPPSNTFPVSERMLGNALLLDKRILHLALPRIPNEFE